MAYYLQETSHIVISNPQLPTHLNKLLLVKDGNDLINTKTNRALQLREARIRLVGWTHMAYALALRIASFLNISMEVHIKYFSTHAMHVWYIYLHLLDFYDKCRWIYNTWMLWVSMGFILVLHWHYKYVVTVCYEKHGVNKLEKLWRKVIALNIGLIREQARRWDHSWMELSDFDMFYNIQNPIKLDNVLFCVVLNSVFEAIKCFAPKCRFFHYIEPAYLWKIRTCHPNWWRHLGAPSQGHCGW